MLIHLALTWPIIIQISLKKQLDPIRCPIASRGRSVPVFLRKPTATCNFRGMSAPPSAPLWIRPFYVYICGLIPLNWLRNSDWILTKLSHDVKCNVTLVLIWASSQENLSSGFPSKRASNQSPQLLRLSRKLKFQP